MFEVLLRLIVNGCDGTHPPTGIFPKMILSEYSIYEFILSQYRNMKSLPKMPPSQSFSIKTSQIVDHFQVSRQFIARMLCRLVKKGLLIKQGITKNSKYSLRDIMF